MFDYTKIKNGPSSSAAEIANVSRRSFLKQLGIGTGAFVLATVMPGFSSILHASPSRGDSANVKADHALNFFVAINPDGSTSIVCHRCEMGQGIRTSIPQIIADEMEADWQQVFVVQGKADKRYGAQGTAGSTSIRNQFIDMRKIGAAARQMLEQAAADMWGVKRSDVTAENHVVKHLLSGKTLSFGELAQTASKLDAPDQKSVKLKSPDQFKLIGKEVKLFDQDDIIAGRATYAQDIQLPGMLIASIERPPVVGSKVVSFDATEALKIKGVVEVVQLKDRPLPVNVLPISGVAVLATNTWAAHQGRKALKVEWQLSEHKSHDSESYLKELVEKVQQPGEAARKKGDVYGHNYDPKNTIEAVYTMPYQHHQPMETPAATAWVQGSGADKKCVIWAGVQNPQWAQGLVATELGFTGDKAADRIEFNITLMGGAFGRKSKADFVLEAVELSNKVKKPVKVVWTREDDIKHGFYHSVSANYMKAELTDKQTADYWIQRVAYPPIGWTFNDKTNRPNHSDLSVGFGDTPFDLQNLSLETQTAEGHVRIGWLRAVACLNNGFALGSFVDELAVKSNISAQKMWMNLLGSDRHVDPKQDGFKYTNYGMGYDTHPLDTKRLKACLNYVCDKANTSEKLPEGQGWGVAVFRSFGTYVSAATKVSVENNTLKVLEMHTAIDCGVAVTPDRVKAQMEGAMVFGLTIGLMGGISVKGGVVVESNFHDSLMTRIHQAPPMFAHIIESSQPPGGVGEPGIPPVIPSITNAIFHACGVRVRNLPVNKHLNVV
ncbi:molybdopterin-dependent oxidoreductase [Psychrosphaera sp. 1_MG-2023]|uniref:xanthine dehydrogenase family protein molybdopterin-binding subunit n=1 Tax=Psychrosphaera sp. 1_MG-2023 TaxID=3062643 RepID=UPI0026E43B5D|nr:molybdopterin cofactor-binding domain-containing protein [Psychrosphaera sp. 1_MG-2023]MDO6719912.1 molybdopterin-dependent oxidoreductase [Psychrosphaera sp. 1_MG-2023]